MESFNACVIVYRKQMQQGAIQKAYQGLLEYVMSLKTRFSQNCPDWAPGNIYHGYMDMTYFPLFPPSLKSRKLKIAIVLVHASVRFEVWLVGYNKQIQSRYWKLFKEHVWLNYRIPATLKGVDSIIEHTLVDNPDFSDLDALTQQIDKQVSIFIADIQAFLSKNNPPPV
jgi:hypothetical protein